MVAQVETAVNTVAPFSYTIAGSVQIFTSPQRGFFADVVAQALRVAGQGTPVLVVQFLKGGISQGCDRAVRLGQYLDWIRCDLPRCVDTPHLDDGEVRSLQQLWDWTRQAIARGKYTLAILDELSLAIHWGAIDEAEVLEFLHQRPPNVDIILTGPQMPASLLEVGDRVTEIRRDRPAVSSLNNGVG